MEQKEAVNLIRKAISPSNEVQAWADFGCGVDATFTNALAQLLPYGSHIYAVDKAVPQRRTVMGSNVSVDFIKADFEKSDFRFSNLNGILMANALHYVEDQKSFIRGLGKYLSADKKFLIIEYDTDAANRWVPYPIGFLKLRELFMQLTGEEAAKIAEHKSIFGQGNLYVAVIGSGIQ
jgi:ubiquinone/menaquinone biosynthesis C-methylase UbiE